MRTRQEQIQDVERRLWDACQSRRPIEPVRSYLGSDDIPLAYEVQELLTLRRLRAGARVVGRKIGLTSPAVQEQLGVDQPDFGVLFDDMVCAEGETIETSRLIAPRIEAELAFVLAEDLDGDDLDIDRVRSSIAYTVPALEIVDSRIKEWDISIVDTVADNASSALYVLGDCKSEITDLDLAAVTMELTANGDTVSSGAGAACLGNPLNAVLWLAATCKDLGLPMRSGEVILSGALGPMVPVESATDYRAEISGLGSVTARFA